MEIRDEIFLLPVSLPPWCFSFLLSVFLVPVFLCNNLLSNVENCYNTDSLFYSSVHGNDPFSLNTVANKPVWKYCLFLTAWEKYLVSWTLAGIKITTRCYFLFVVISSLLLLFISYLLFSYPLSFSLLHSVVLTEQKCQGWLFAFSKGIRFFFNFLFSLCFGSGVKCI